MSRIVDIEPLLKKYDGMNEGTEFSPIHFINDLMALEQQPSEDCISRQAVEDSIYDYSRSCDVNYEQIMEFIDKLPSVKPKYTDEEIDKAQAVEQAYVDKMVELAVKETKRPKGKWIIIDDCELFMAKCSECGEIVDSRMINKYPYCHCGAEMSGGDEDEDGD